MTDCWESGIVGPARPPRGPPDLGQLLFALAYSFVGDLSQYGFHRLKHASPVLWETHRIHHDETALSAPPPIGGPTRPGLSK